jgi:predicted  nucleic acid-binding Zn-ribbon protein
MGRILIPTYKAEIDAGLGEKVSTTASFAYASLAQLTDSPAERPKLNGLALAQNNNQFDLHYMKSILATIGWNLNDDVVDRTEGWIARHTAEDKPLDYEHDPNDIIGHVTGSYLIDLEGNPLDDSKPLDELPDSFHIVNTEVVYQWPNNTVDPKITERMAQIIAEIKDGKWYVSMEALFTNFDYAVIASDGSQFVIPRDDKSAFLTKHLRAYGGSGVYNGNKIGRQMRNITFSGKGIVRRPGNPNSIIFESVANFHPTVMASAKEFARVGISLGYENIGKDTNSKTEIDNMPDTNVELVQAENKRLESTLKAAQERAEAAEKKLHEMNANAVQAKLDNLNTEVKARDEKITSLNTQVDTEQKARTQAEAKVKELEGKVATLESDFAKQKAEQVKATRLGVIKAKLNFTDEDAGEFYETVAELSDEKFNKLVEKTPAKAAAQNTADDKSKKTDDTGKGGASAGVTDPKVLDNVTPEKKAGLGTDGVNTTVEQTRANLSKFIGENFLGRKKKVNA